MATPNPSLSGAQRIVQRAQNALFQEMRGVKANNERILRQSLRRRAWRATGEDSIRTLTEDPVVSIDFGEGFHAAP